MRSKNMDCNMVKLFKVRERSSEIKLANKRAREDDALERIAQLI